MSSWIGSGPWSERQIEDYLEHIRIPLRLACIDRGEVPRVVSLWFEWESDAFYCATQRGSAVARWLGARPQVGFEVASNAPPYLGIRGTGVASLDEARGSRQLRRLLDRYDIGQAASLRSALLRNEQSEVCIRIQPNRVDSWDYTERMADVR